MTPYYDEDGVTLYCGDALAAVVEWDLGGALLLTDPPYGIGYESGQYGTLPRSIAGDRDTTVRDRVLEVWGDRPALVFGSWRAPRPARTRALLVWDTGGALGMGDLSLPWKPSHQEVYVISGPFEGRRTSDVLQYPPVQSMATNGRTHPNEKPVGLLKALIGKCPALMVVDPFAGTGSTLVAARAMGRHAVGIEIEERYCEVAAQRLSQRSLFGEAMA